MWLASQMVKTLLKYSKYLHPWFLWKILKNVLKTLIWKYSKYMDLQQWFLSNFFQKSFKKI